MSRIARRFAALKEQGRGALIPYLQACDPDYDTSLALLRAMPGAGADLIEIGVPFSDPSADGPTIQLAARRGLKAGSSMVRVLEMVARFREDDADTPIILMGYLNPIEAYGHARFCADAARAGVDGLIVVDMPPEEADLPVAIGFGIRSPGQAAAAVRAADAAVVASALIQTLEESLDEEGRATPDTLPRVLAQLSDLAKAVRTAR